MTNKEWTQWGDAESCESCGGLTTIPKRPAPGRVQCRTCFNLSVPLPEKTP